MAGSEMAWILAQIELEHAAAVRALTAFSAGAARHEYISKRMENIGVYHEQLAVLIGPERAIQRVAEVIESLARFARTSEAFSKHYRGYIRHKMVLQLDAD